MEGAPDVSGRYYGRVLIEGSWWAIVIWDGEDLPELYKAGEVEVTQEQFIKLM
jgi:hypothetical protein